MLFNYKKKRIFTSLCLCIISLAIYCQEYTLEVLQNSMIDNNPDLLKLQEDYRQSLLDVKDAQAGFGPSIDLQVTGTYMVNPPIDAVYINADDIISSINWPSGITPSSTGQYIKVYDGMENTLYNFSLSLEQPLFTWGKLTNALKLYKLIADVKLTQYTSQLDQLNTELETRVITLKYLDEISSILEEEKQYTSRLVETSENAQRSGMLLKQDVTDAKIKAMEIDIAQQDLSEQLNDQLLEIRRMTGIKELDVKAIAYEIDETFIENFMAKDRKSLEALALSDNQSSIHMIKKLREINEIAVKIAKGYENWKPDVALQLDLGYGGSRLPLVEPNWLRKDDYSANITLGIKTTIWDGGKKLNDIARKKSAEKVADINEIDVESNITKTINSLWNTIDVCSLKIEYQDLKIDSSDSKIKQQETVYQSGYGSETDVLSAKIEKCNEEIEKKQQELQRYVACMTIKALAKEE